jgi:glucosamine kinase
MEEPLVKLLFEAFGIRSAARVGGAVAGQGGAAGLGRHAHIIFEAENRGSLIARQLIRDGARHLVDLIARLKDKGSDATIVVAGGGVIVAQPSLAEAFLQELAGRFGGAVTGSIYAGPPVDGACRLAARLNLSTAGLQAAPSRSATSS